MHSTTHRSFNLLLKMISSPTFPFIFYLFFYDHNSDLPLFIPIRSDLPPRRFSYPFFSISSLGESSRRREVTNQLNPNSLIKFHKANLHEFDREKQGKTMGERGQGGKNTNKWPSIKPKKDLQITRLKDTHLFTVQNFMTSAESKAFIKFAESMGFIHQGSLGPTKGEAYRDNDRISVVDPILAETIWESGLKKLFADIKIRGKVAVGLNPNIRFYRYKVGQRFGRHIDESVDLENRCRTYYTLLIYLNGGAVRSRAKNDLSSNQDPSLEPLVGGETVFYDSRRVVAEVAPTEGMALLHIHGDKCMLHEARNVTRGVKYVFRSDVAFA